ncbi:MAG: ATPase [bacterium]|nr:ATPase [bacterium]
MAEELQQLLEKIQHDGVEKANAESAAILAKAKADAAAILKDAESKAAALRAQAETDAKAFEERAQKTISQAARDTVLEVKDAIGRMLEKLLAKDVAAALADPSEAAKLALAAVNELGSNADVAAGEKLAAALKAQLAAEAKAGVKVVLDESVGTGFSIRLDGGRVEHDFSESAIVAALAKRLRPDLAKLVNA